MWGKRKAKPNKRDSNVQLTPEQIAESLRRFNAKKYSSSTCFPLPPRVAAAIEDKLGLRKKKKE